MDTKEIEEKVREFIADHLGIDEDKVIPEAELINDLGADSLDELEIVMFCEDEFDIEIPDEDLNEIKTVGQAISYIVEALK